MQPIQLLLSTYLSFGLEKRLAEKFPGATVTDVLVRRENFGCWFLRILVERNRQRFGISCSVTAAEEMARGGAEQLCRYRMEETVQKLEAMIENPQSVPCPAPA
jgi:hypothetical protein